MVHRRVVLGASSAAILGAASCGVLVSTAAVAVDAAVPTGRAPAPHRDARTRAFELTFMRSMDPNPEAGARFIRANWYAMDAVAVDRGLMTSYELLTAAEDAADWNLLMVVGYPDPQGYSAIAAEFERIRAAHQTQLVDGKGFRELLQIVGSRRLLSG